jgi:GNAT superfamily N-acetyltransferase
MDPLTFATLPCRRDAGTARLRGTGHLGFTACTAVLWVEPAARRQGLARALLMALAQQFPGIGTSVTVPETFTPLFAAAGYSPLSLQQYEMTMELTAAKLA